MSHFPNLFSPVRLGKLTAKNRIMSSAHGERMSENNVITDREIAYYAEKARGGTGIIVLDGVRTNIETAPNQNSLISGAPGQMERYGALAAAVHEHDALMIGQVLHQGAQTQTTYSRRALVSASAIANPVYREVPHALTPREISRVIDDLCRAAEEMMEGGLDGVELHAAHGYLIGQFLSPKTNHRDDAFGGGLANRMRFGVEAIRAMRRSLGDAPFGVRLNSEDLTDGGCTREDMLEIAGAFVDAGALDYLSISVGTYHDDGLSVMVGDHGYKPGFLAANARPFKRMFPDLPIVTVGRITTPELAEDILARGDADICAMTRALIADPEWGVKAQAGESGRIRPCIACNTCLTMNRAVTPITCAVNPACGEEQYFGTAAITAAEDPRQVTIVGGGVAGLEAARSAALRGHRVTLHEAAGKLGGQVELLSRTRNRAAMMKLVDYYRTELTRLNVTVRLNSRVTEDTLDTAEGEIILATGAVGHAEAGFDTGGVPVVDSFRLLHDPGVTDGVARVLLLDRDHGYGATAIAHYLRELGCETEMLTENPMVGQDLPPGALAGALQRLVAAGVRLHPLSRVAGIVEGTARITNLLNGLETAFDGVDLIVIVGDRRSEDSLFHHLEEGGPAPRLIGDAMAPRQIWQAVRDGFFAGQAI